MAVQINWVVVIELVKSVFLLVIELVKALAWPTIALVALYVFRRPFADLVAQIARRASKFSVYEVSVELATVSELSPPWSTGSEDVRHLSSSQIFDSGTRTLFEELLKSGKADYVLVDLGSGREWLTSRLFVFALVLGQVTKVRAFAFVENTGSVRRRFIGVATPARIEAAMARQYPWLAEAYFRTANAQYQSLPAGAPVASQFTKEQPPLFLGVEPGRVNNFVRKLVENLQRTTPAPPDEAESYLELKAGGRWERAYWIDGERLERDLGGDLASSSYQYSPDAPRRAVVEAVARRDGAFVAFVDQDYRFLSLIDRYAVLDQMGKRDAAGNNVEESKTG